MHADVLCSQWATDCGKASSWFSALGGSSPALAPVGTRGPRRHSRVFTAFPPHAALLPPCRLPPVGCSVGWAAGDHRTAKPHAHPINASTAGIHMRIVY